jgi:hypothetical protein
MGVHDTGVCDMALQYVVVDSEDYPGMGVYIIKKII